MTGDMQVTERAPDYARLGIGVLACVFVPVAALSEPSSWWFVLALVAGALGMVAWALQLVSAQVIAIPVVLLVSLSQAESRLEPGLFVLCLLAIALTGWSDLTWSSVLLVALTAAAPVVIALLQDEHGISGGVWVMGVIFPALMGWAP